MVTADTMAAELPYLRRFARAITGNQQSGDAYVASALETVIADPMLIDGRASRRVCLYRTLVKLINSISINRHSGADEPTVSAEHKLQMLTPPARQAFLLIAVEELSFKDAAEVLEVSEDRIIDLLDEANREMAAQIATNVLIIEDEPLIAYDLRRIVTSLGHRVTALARTEKEALAAVAMERPGLVLADIHLADGSSGLDAVGKLLKTGGMPVIFVTAYPERLLTGKRPEPTFLLAKPFQPDVLKAVISQALFFDIKAH